MKTDGNGNAPKCSRGVPGSAPRPAQPHSTAELHHHHQLTLLCILSGPDAPYRFTYSLFHNIDRELVCPDCLLLVDLHVNTATSLSTSVVTTFFVLRTLQ